MSLGNLKTDCAIKNPSKLIQSPNPNFTESEQFSPEAYQEEIRSPFHFSLSFPEKLIRFQTSDSINPVSHSATLSKSVKANEIPLDFTESVRNSRKLLPTILQKPINTDILRKPASPENLSQVVVEDNKENLTNSIVGNKEFSALEKKKNIEKISISSVVTEGMLEKLGFENIETVEDGNTIEKANDGSEAEKKVDWSPGKISLKVRQSQTEIFVLGFDQALRVYEDKPVGYIEGSLWIETFWDRCCCDRNRAQLPNDFQECCEKLFIFAYSHFNICDIFHASLVNSVYRKLEEILKKKDDFVGIGFSSDNPLLKDLKHNVANFGLLLMLFLIEYIPYTLGNMIKYCLNYRLAFIPIAFDIAEFAIFVMRRKKLHLLMVETQKCLETLFFFYAGCLSQWFILHEKYKYDLSKLTNQMKKQALDDPNKLIDLTKDLIKVETEEN